MATTPRWNDPNLALFVANLFCYMSMLAFLGNKRGELRPEFFIMPPFKIAGPGFGALMAGYVIRQIIRIEKRLCILWNSCAQVNCAVPAI
ncbi:TPA: hypothetical protein ACSP82_000599 [Aeromonas veronii]